MHEVTVEALDPARFSEVLPEDRYEAFSRTIAEGRSQLDGVTVWNVNTTSAGGGVAEMLHPLIGYCLGAGVDTRWVVFDGDEDFFALTKRIHNRLHGSKGDGGPLGDAEHELFERTTRANFDGFAGRVRKGDVVIVHDPQPAALCGPLREAGAHVVWRCHIGIDSPNDVVRETWDFLRRYVEPADAYIFTRESYIWDGLERSRSVVIPPSIDAFSAKNEDLGTEEVSGILAAAGLRQGGDPAAGRYRRHDGTEALVGRPAAIHGGRTLPSGVPLITQVSRWDALKDPLGVMRGFADHVADGTDAHLLLVGPDVEAVTDDPEGLQVLRDCQRACDGYESAIAERIHLITLPMDDGEENAAMVNAIQRASSVIVQKSLAEGFGLTVTEGMWKARPLLASRVGGIQDQIVDGQSGLLVDPEDLAAFGAAATRLVREQDFAERVGDAGRERVRDEFLAPRHFGQYLELLARVRGARTG